MSSENPMFAPLSFQQELMEATTDAFEASTEMPDQLEKMESVDVGQTPSEVVYTENKLELLHYESLTDEQHRTPILIVYALINKPFILDLQPDRSVVRRLLEAGHDVYLVDWNEPSRLDRHLALEDYVNRYIDNCVDVVRERSDEDRINILGYCMGGTMTVMYTALHQEKVRTLGLMAAGLCFDRTGGVLELWGDQEYYDPEDVVDAYGNVPAEMLDVGFALMDPVANYVSKYVRLYDNLENDDFVENFGRMEQWLDEGIDVAGEAYVQFLRDVYQENRLQRNEMYLGGEHVDVTEIEVPVLQITGEYDHLIPAAASKPFNDVIGSDDVHTIEYPTGHIGLSVSGSSHENVWPEVCDWFAERGTGEAESEQTTLEESEATDIEIDDESTDEAVGAEEEPEAEEPPEAAGEDIATITGIGPTYADRLRGIGIETTADLAAAEVDTVAEAAQVSESRAQDWLDQI